MEEIQQFEPFKSKRRYSSYEGMSSIQNHAHTSPTRQLTQRFSTLASFELDESGTNNYARLLQYNACYEAMPTNSKLVVLDVGLSLKKAFNGLIYQNTRHVLLSDQKSNSSIVGVLSVTDFIRVLLHMYKYGCSNEVKRESGEVTKKDSGPPCTSGLAFEDISMFTIEQYQNLVGRKEDLPSLVHVHAEDSLLKAVRLLSAHKIHRLPVLDSKTGSPLFILTHKRLLKFMWLYGQSLSIPDYRLKSCKDLGIGTWDGVRVVHPDTLVLECLDILITKSVSGLPVVERNTFKVVDMYSRFDAIGIALEDRINNLRNVTVSEALEFRNTFRKKGDRVLSIMADDSLWKALTVFVERNVHRLTAVDCDGAVKGLISLSDVLNYMIIMPGAPLPNESPRKRKSFMRSPKNLPVLRESHALRATDQDIQRHGQLSMSSGGIQKPSILVSSSLDEGALQHLELDKQFSAIAMK